MKNIVIRTAVKFDKLKCYGRKFLRKNSGQGAIDQAIIILICVVLGALLLAGLYALVDSTVMPTLTQKIQEMFNYTN